MTIPYRTTGILPSLLHSDGLLIVLTDTCDEKQEESEAGGMKIPLGLRVDLQPIVTGAGLSRIGQGVGQEGRTFRRL